MSREDLEPVPGPVPQRTGPARWLLALLVVAGLAASLVFVSETPAPLTVAAWNPACATIRVLNPS